MLPKPLKTAYLFIYPVADWHYHVWEPAFRLLMLRIRCPTDVLQLVAVPTSHIPLNPVLVLPLPRLVGFILGIDPVEPPGAFTGCVLKAAAFDPAVEAAADHSLEVSLIAVKHLVPRVVLPQDLFWSSEDHSCGCLKGKCQVLRPGFGMRISADLAHLLARHTLTPIRLNIKELAEHALGAVPLRQIQLHSFPVRGQGLV